MKTIETYKFDQLPIEVQNKIISNNSGININAENLKPIKEEIRMIGAIIKDRVLNEYMLGINPSTPNLALKNLNPSHEVYKLSLDYFKDIEQTNKDLQRIKEYNKEAQKHDLKYFLELFRLNVQDYYNKTIESIYKRLLSYQEVRKTIINRNLEYTSNGKILAKCN